MKYIEKIEIINGVEIKIKVYKKIGGKKPIQYILTRDTIHSIRSKISLKMSNIKERGIKLNKEYIKHTYENEIGRVWRF